MLPKYDVAVTLGWQDSSSVMIDHCAEVLMSFSTYPPTTRNSKLQLVQQPVFNQIVCVHFAFESKSCILYMSGESQYFSAIYLSERKAITD